MRLRPRSAANRSVPDSLASGHGGTKHDRVAFGSASASRYDINPFRDRTSYCFAQGRAEMLFHSKCALGRGAEATVPTRDSHCVTWNIHYLWRSQPNHLRISACVSPR